MSLSVFGRAFARLRRSGASTTSPDAGTDLTETRELPQDALETADAQEGESAEEAGQDGRSRRPARATVAVAAVAALVVAGAGVAAAQANKVVTLDVDGQVEQLSTWRGTVEGLLQDEGITLAAHDALTPAGDTALADGQTVVVRTAHEVTVFADGETSTEWVTSLTADGALSALAARGEDVALVPSRSTSGRLELPLDLVHGGEVDVVADGATSTVSGVSSLGAVLLQAEVSVDGDDRVQVRHDVESGRIVVRVQRIEVTDEPTVDAVDFETVQRNTSDLYTGQSRVVTAGVPGERTRVDRVTRVDGAEESRRTISDEVTREPVTKVVEVGTASRPAPAPSGGSGGSVGGDVWAALAQCESGGNPRAVSSNGLYYGLYQFSVGTWQSVGGSGLPSNASAAEQTSRAQALQARSGWGQWPYCSSKLGLR